MGGIRYLIFICQSLIPRLSPRSFKKSSTSWIPLQKSKLILVFVLRNVETGEYRCCYALESNTLLKKSPLLLLDGSLFIEKFDIVEQCTQERQITKLRFNLITNVTIFAALLKNIPMGCPHSVLPEPLLKKPFSKLSFIG